MHSHPTHRARRIARVLVASGAVLLATGVASSPAGGQAEDNVTICHATNSNSNPYSELTVPESAVDQVGNNDHFGEHTGPIWNPTLKANHETWGDIIPPQPDVPGGEDGLNWSAEGQAIHANGCAIPNPVPTRDVTLDKVTAGGTAPSASTDFAFSVVCDSGTVTAAPSIAAEDVPTVVADDVAEGDVCTITETGANGAATTTFQVTGGANAAPTANSVTFNVGVGADVAVVVTNTYPDPTVVVNNPPPVVQGNVVTPAPAAVAANTLARTGSPADFWYVLAGIALLLGGVTLYSSQARRLLGLRSR